MLWGTKKTLIEDQPRQALLGGHEKTLIFDQGLLWTLSEMSVIMIRCEFDVIEQHPALSGNGFLLRH